MTGLFIRVEEVESDGRHQLKVTIDNCRNENATNKECEYTNLLETGVEKLAEKCLTDAKLKNARILYHTVWPDKENKQ